MAGKKPKDKPTPTPAPAPAPAPAALQRWLARERAAKDVPYDASNPVYVGNLEELQHLTCEQV
jgi:hypothetical protein